jgi:glutamate dehydrogenase/leucine dehydrogenase
MSESWNSLMHGVRRAGTALFLVIGVVAALAISQPAGATSLGIEASSLLSTPVVSSVSPSSGPKAGGTLVTIQGSGFTGATSVKFGTGIGDDVTVVSDTEVTAVSPSAAPGVHHVTVTTPGGTSAVGNADRFTYLGPVITAISPNAGPVQSETEVTITGSGFTSATAVAFGPLASPGFNVISDSEIMAIAPQAPSPGVRNVSVTTPNGTSATVPADQYDYAVQASITSVSPSSGPQQGGTTVTLTGAGFTGATSVTFGAVAGTDLTVLSDSSLTVVSPAGDAGHDPELQVTAPGGKSLLNTKYRFTYTGPVITSISPNSGSTAGGTTVTINGSGLTGATQVKFGGTPATDVTVVSDSQITAVTPAKAAGLTHVSVTTPEGTSQTAPFTYVASGG